MFTKSVKEYLDEVRENRSYAPDKGHEMTEFNLLGYHPAIALVPTSLRGRPEEDGEATWTYLIHEIFPEMSAYCVVFDGDNEGLRTPLWHSMLLEIQAINFDFLAGFMSLLYHGLMRHPARDHHLISNVRHDLVAEMGLWPARDCMSDRFTAGVMSLVNDIIYIKGEEELIKCSGLPPEVINGIRKENELIRISEGII